MWVCNGLQTRHEEVSVPTNQDLSLDVDSASPRPVPAVLRLTGEALGLLPLGKCVI